MSKQNVAIVLLTAAAAPLADAAIQQASKLPGAISAQRAQRREPKLRNEAIYRHVYKARRNGESALALGNEASEDERQRIVADSAEVRDALHDQLADLRLSSAGRKSDLVDATQTAVRGTDRLVAALKRWALDSSDGTQASDLQEAVQALEASENALLSCMRKTRRLRPGKGGDAHPSDGETGQQRQTGTGWVSKAHLAVQRNRKGNRSDQD